MIYIFLCSCDELNDNISYLNLHRYLTLNKKNVQFINLLLNVRIKRDFLIDLIIKFSDKKVKNDIIYTENDDVSTLA